MTGPMIFDPEYYTHMAAFETHSWWNAGMRTSARRLLARAGLAATGRMLDLGCGSGQTLTWFSTSYPGWTTVGFDLARDGLPVAKRQGNIVCAASALDLPFPAASCDVVVTLDVLQHLPLGGGDRRALAEIRRVLRPGGVVLLRTNAQSVPRVEDDPRHNFHKYTGRELRELLSSAGLHVERMGRLNALLGLAEIPREWRAQRATGGGYTGHLGRLSRRGPGWYIKRAILEGEGFLVSRGASLPLGRSILALARTAEPAP